MADSPPDSYDVLVVGAGPVGLAMAAELGQRGVRALVVEQNTRTGQQPRAKTTNTRTMAHMRRWGLAQRLHERSPLPRSYPRNVAFKTRLYGEPLVTVEDAFNGDQQRRDERFPEPAHWIPQYKVEAVLREHAETLPSIAVRFGCRLDSFTETSDSVEAVVTTVDNDGARSRVRARYLVGADGARSVVRTLIGAKMEGQYAFAKHMNLVIRTKAMREVMATEPAIMYWLVNPDAPSGTTPMDEGDLCTFGFAVGLDQTVGETQLRERIDAAYGRATDAEIVTIDPWAAHSLIADRYAKGRAFLIGDACHLHPPYGGYGMNLGIADAVDLGWKLAAVLQGWGGPKLLASYEAERRPVHQRTIAEAVANHSVLPHNLVTSDIEAAGEAGEAARRRLSETIRATKTREFHTLGVVLGYHYGGSPIVVDDGTAAPAATDHATYAPSAHPGCLAPHAWLADGQSLYDLFGPGFTLLLSDADAGQADALRGAAQARNLPLRIVERPPHAALGDLYRARMALIRPDQHVAWRGDRLDRSASAIIDTVRGAAGPDAATRPNAA